MKTCCLAAALLLRPSQVAAQAEPPALQPDLPPPRHRRHHEHHHGHRGYHSLRADRASAAAHAEKPAEAAADGADTAQSYGVDPWAGAAAGVAADYLSGDEDNTTVGGRRLYNNGHVSTEGLDPLTAACVKFLSTIYTEPAPKEDAIALVAHSCMGDDRVDDKNHSCVHLGAMLTFLLEDVPPGKDMTPVEFCQLSQEAFYGLKGAFHVPNLGSGAFLDFSVSSGCAPTVDAVIGVGATIKKKQMPDFWYALCMNQDCASYLPSRTRWCEYTKSPSHNNVVCEAARGWAFHRVKGMSLAEPLPEEIGQEQICTLYGDFSQEIAQNIKTWDSLIHGGPAALPPTPPPPKKEESGGMFSGLPGLPKFKPSNMFPGLGGSGGGGVFGSGAAVAAPAPLAVAVALSLVLAAASASARL